MERENLEKAYKSFVSRYGHTRLSYFVVSFMALDSKIKRHTLLRDGLYNQLFWKSKVKIEKDNLNLNFDKRVKRTLENLSVEHENLVCLNEHTYELFLDEFKNPPRRMMTILPIGIFVGEPRDINELLFHGNNNPSYPIMGFGEKIAEIKLFYKNGETNNKSYFQRFLSRVNFSSFTG